MAAHPLSRLLAYARPHRGTVVWASVCSILNKVLDLAPPALIGMAVDVVVQGETSFLAALGVTEVESQLWVLAIGTVFIFALESLFEYLYAVLWRNLAQTLQHELRLSAWDHLQRLDMAYLEDQRTGRLMTILGDDVNQLERFLDGGANEILQLATTVVVIGVAFASYSAELALLAALPMPVVIWGSLWFQGRLKPLYAQVRERAGILGAHLSAALTGMEALRSFAAESLELARVGALSQAYKDANRQAITVSSAFTPLIRMAIVVGFGTTLIHGGLMVTRGELAVGSYSVLVFLSQRLLWPLTRLGATVDTYQRGMASAARVLDLLDLGVSITSGPRRLPVGEIRGAIAFEDVAFAYPGRAPALRGLSLAIPAGSTLGIVGATGAGKTTLARLLLRFHDPAAGVVRLDGEDLRTLDLGDLRRAIGLVSQGIFLIHGTVAENLRYARPDATVEELEAALAAAEALAFVRALPQGLDTIIGERGQKLSGGQQQRLALARAVLKDPPILLLDEATSAVDNETEAAIQRSLARISQGRTTLIIAHRLSTVRRADTIVVLEDGRLAEQGTHDELIALGGLYGRLWGVQTGGA